MNFLLLIPLSVQIASGAVSNCRGYCIHTGQIKTGRVLRRAPPPPPKEKSTRDTVLDLIRDGGVTLRKAEPIQKSSEQVGVVVAK